MYYRMSCPRCWTRIEYTDVQVGHFHFCKKCNQEVVLRSNPIRVSMFIICAAVFVACAYGGMRFYRMAQKEGRHSYNLAAPVEQPVRNVSALVPAA